MRNKKHPRHGGFWRNWHESEQTSKTSEVEKEFDTRRAWHRHFSEFLGETPDNHWLFSGRRFKPWTKPGWGPPGMFNPFVADLMSKGGGLLSLLVLHLLSEQPRYGNDIMREIEERTGGHWGSNPGAIYPLLSAMEESGLADGHWEDPDKRTRRIYKLTDNGRKELERLKEIMRPKLEEAIRVMRDISNGLEIEED